MTDYTLKVVVAGDSGVGKTDLISRHARGGYSEGSDSALGVNFYVKEIIINGYTVKFHIWDLNGAIRFRYLLNVYVRGANGALLMFDGTKQDALNSIEEWISLLREEYKDLPIVLIRTKKYVNENHPNTVNSSVIENALKTYNLVGYFETSSKTGENVEQAFNSLAYKIIGIEESLEISPSLEEDISIEDQIIFIMELLGEAKNRTYNHDFSAAKLIIDKAHDFSIKYDLNKTLIKVKELDEQLNNDIILSQKALVENKKQLRDYLYKQKFLNCPLHEELDAFCSKIDKIKQKIEEPSINGFVMYEFPNDTKSEYSQEIDTIKSLIDIQNKDSLIKIDFPSEVTGLDIKTCDFCRIARSYDFGLLILNPPNVNAYLETGMFLSLGKKVILFNNEKRQKSAPFDLSPYFYIQYDNLEDLETNWYRKIPKYLENIKNYYLNYVNQE
ncbi:MAG: Rab family GTPase [Promethearchaeota archaeon]